MKNVFESLLRHVLVHEGGYVDHPKDPGGATNKGVTLAVFQRFYGASMGKDDLRAITNEQLAHIYKTGYWDTCRCDDLPAGVDYVVFDQAVNSGPGRSAKWLQAVVGATVDGMIGPQTIAATLQQSATQVVNDMCDKRLTFLKRLSLWETFGRGWQKRIESVREVASWQAVSRDAARYAYVKTLSGQVLTIEMLRTYGAAALDAALDAAMAEDEEAST